MKRSFALLVLLLTPLIAFAADPIIDRPHWSLDLKGGSYIPEFGDWSTYFKGGDAGTYGGSFSYKLLRQLELGVEGRYVRASGQGNAPLHAAAAGATTFLAGDVTYELAPLNVFVLARGVFNENQWLIPYAGGGWTRMFYREEVKDQGVARGRTDGYHARAGIQFVLDGLDAHAAHNIRADYGIDHTSLFIEMEYIRAIVDTAGGSVDLGGKSWVAGLLFEF